MRRENGLARIPGLRLLCLLFAGACTGCGPSAGAWIYMLGLEPKQKSTAEYKLPPGPVLILIDDDQDLVQPPTMRQMFVDSLAKQLKEHKIADHVTTNEELARVRQSNPKFDQRGAREAGQLVGADTVIWLAIRQFSMEKDIEYAVAPAQFAATLKVVNAKAEKRDDVRLWPLDREGRLMEVSISPQELHKLAIKTEIYQKIADEMADKVAKLFYDYQIEQ